MTLRLVLFLVLPLALISGQVTDISVTATNTQALIQYTPPVEGVCSVEVSESPSYVPVVADVDSQKFPGASLDNRIGTISSGQVRTFIAGKRITERGTDGIAYSRALQAATAHYFRINCGGAVATGTFSTTTVPFGLTYTDPIPPDPLNPGEVLWPQLDYSDRTRSYVDPQSGVLLKRLTGPADIYTFGARRCASCEERNFQAWPAASITGRVSSHWSGGRFPYTIANSTDSLIALASGWANWGYYPYNPARTMSYASDTTAHLNWLEVRLTGRTSNSSCNSTVSDACKVTLCLSTDRTTCHPYSQQIDVSLKSASSTTVVGSQSYVGQGGWLKPGKRWLNGPETTDYAGVVTCDGTSSVTTTWLFNLAWGPGSKITINNVEYEIASVRHEAALTLTSPCPAGSWNFTASNFAVLVHPKVAGSGTITIENLESLWEFGLPPAWGAAAYWDYSSRAQTPGPDGRPGYMIMLPAFQGIYWIDAETGNSRLLSQDINGNQGCIGLAPQFDLINPAKWYCLALGIMRSFEYRGDFADAVSGPSTGFSELRPPDCNNSVNPSNKPCLVNTHLTAGTSLQSLVQAFDPLYDPVKYPSPTPVGINQDGRLIAYFYRGQENTPAWIIAFDPNAATNNEPGNAGCVSAAVNDASRHGCVVAALPTWLRGAGRGHPMKGDVLPNVASGWLRYQPMLWYNTALDGMGFWQMNTSGGFAFNTTVATTGGFNDVPGGLNTCPPNPFNITGKRCTQVTVTSEPFDASPGPTESGAPGEYLTAQPGDLLYINGGGHVSTNWEMVGIVARTGLTLTVARAQVRGLEACPQIPADCAAGSSVPLASTPNPVLNYAASAPPIYWNYADDPHGLKGGTYDNRYLGRNHSSGRFVGQVSVINKGDDARCVVLEGCYASIYLDSSTNSIYDMLDSPMTGLTTTNPPFAGIAAFAYSNSVQLHPSQMGHDATPLEQQYFLDGRPFNGIYAPDDESKPVAQNVGNHLWRFPASAPNSFPLHRKFLATKAQTGWHPLIDVSGPSCSISTEAEDSYKYGVVVKPNECYAGSQPGDIYFNVPYLHYPFCLFPGQAGNSGPDATDICILDQGMVQDSIMQMKLNAGIDVTGATTRWLTKGFAASRMNPPFGNVQALANNKWGLFRTRFLNGFRHEAMLLKFPPLESDSVDRGTFQEMVLPITAVPPGTSTAVVEFGYAENGPPGSLYCTSRAETCAVGRAAESNHVDMVNPFYFAHSESARLAGTPCSSGCEIAVPVIAARVPHYRVRYRDAASNTIAVTSIQVAAIP